MQKKYPRVLRAARRRLAAAGLAGLALALGSPPASPAAAAADTGHSADPAEGSSGASVSVLELRKGFYMLTVDGVNLALQTGAEGAVVVNAGPANASAALLKSIRQLSTGPIRFVIDTSADPELTGGNATLSSAGLSMMIGWQILTRNHNRPESIQDHPLDTRAPIIARQEVLEQLLASAGPKAQLLSFPSETFTREQYNLRVNGDIINVASVPAAHSSSDSVVLFRRADVLVTGAIFDIRHFRVIDLAHGGSIDGEIAAINQVMNTLAVPSEGGGRCRWHACDSAAWTRLQSAGPADLS